MSVILSAAAFGLMSAILSVTDVGSVRAPSAPIGSAAHLVPAIAHADESTRPLLHFTPEKNWTNDPNGLIWLDGEYHLFYQYNPFGDQWGHMSWGHAVSKDLLVWEHLPVAIPEADGVMAFSGTCVYDAHNTSGFGAEGRPPLIAAYTGHEEKAKRQHQNLAFSTDRGRTWTKYTDNPVIDLQVAEFRDPKVFWHAPTKRWIMAVALAAERKALFYASANLKQWTKLSEFGPQGRADVPNWECPDLFEMAVDGNPSDTRWVLVINVGGNGPTPGSGCQYFVGTFDGEKFTNENPSDKVLWLDHGKDFYAFQSYQDAPGGKRIGLAWMANTWYAGATPTSPWRGSMTIPREFSLRRTPDGVRMAQKPIDGITSFLRRRFAAEGGIEQSNLPNGITPMPVSGAVAFIEAEFDIGAAERFGVRVLEHGDEFTAIGYDAVLKEIYIDRQHSGRVNLHDQFSGRHAAPFTPPADGRVKLTIVVDRTSVEAFSDDGLAAVTSLVFPNAESRGMSLFAEKGACKNVRVRAIVIEKP